MYTPLTPYPSTPLNEFRYIDTHHLGPKFTPKHSESSSPKWVRRYDGLPEKVLKGTRKVTRWDQRGGSRVSSTSYSQTTYLFTYLLT